MKETSAQARLSYPVHALLLIGVSWCFYAIVALALALFMLPIVPLAPVFVMILVALGGLLSSVHEYARSVATPTRATRLRSRIDGQVSQVPPRAKEAY